MPNTYIGTSAKMSLTDFIKKSVERHPDAEFEEYVDLIVELDEINDYNDLHNAICLDAFYILPNGKQVKFGAWNNQTGVFWPDEDVS